MVMANLPISGASSSPCRWPRRRPSRLALPPSWTARARRRRSKSNISFRVNRAGWAATRPTPPFCARSQIAKLSATRPCAALARLLAFRYSSSMRALITGINGFLGSHLAEHLLAAGKWEVWGLARQQTLRLAHLSGQVQLVVADLDDLEQVVAVLQMVQPDIIFHLAGQSNV